MLFYILLLFHCFNTIVQLNYIRTDHCDINVYCISLSMNEGAKIKYVTYFEY